MAKEVGVVLRLAGGTAWVSALQNSACGSCSSREGCVTHGPKVVEVQALNLAGAATGDRVELICDSGPLLRATFLIYLFPVLCLLLGAAFGQWLGGQLGYDLSLTSAAAGFVGLTLAMTVVRRGGNRLARHAAYQPKIAKILARATPEPAAVGPLKPVS